MRSFYISLLFAGFVVMMAACKKQTVYQGQVATISVFNGLDDTPPLYGNYSGSTPVSYNASQYLYLNTGASVVHFEDTLVKASFYAQPDTLAHDKPVLSPELHLQKGYSYSLYLAGNKQNADYLFTANHFQTTTASDSVTFLQVVNISNDQPVSVNIAGAAKGSFVSNLAYKSASPFIELSADQNHPEYTFEFRDASTGDVLWTETVAGITGTVDSPNKFLYKNWTLVFMGKRGVSGANAIKTRQLFYQLK